MANTTIQLRKSATPGSVPSAGSLANGELALNFADGILYYKAANGTVSSIYSGTPSFGTVNAAGTLLIADTVNDVLDIAAGSNILITGDAVNDRFTIAADLMAANNWANTKLANTSDTSFNGNLYFPTGNVAIGSSTTLGYKLRVASGAILLDNSQPLAFLNGAGASMPALQLTSANNLQIISPSTSGSIQFILMNNSGIYQFYNSSTGSELARITNAGYFGLGTNAPSYILDVQANTGGNQYIQVKNNGAGRAGIVLNSGGTSDSDVVFQNQGIATATIASFSYASSAPLAFYANNGTTMVEIARFNNAGYLGLDVQSPAHRLDVNGSANISSPTLLVAGQNVLSTIAATGTGSNAYATLVGTSANAYTVSIAASANNWANTKLSNTSGITFAGDFNIPGKLYITSENSDSLRTRFISGKASTTTAAGSLYLNYSISNFVQVGDGATATSFYIANGNLGVGTVSPTAKLHVSGNTHITGNINIPTSASYAIGDSNIITYSGGNIRLSDTGGGIGLYSTSLAAFALYQSSTGQIGIGTTSPSSKLHVFGNTNLAGDVVISGNLTTSGTVTYANTQTLLIGDAIVSLNADLPAAIAPTENAGFEVNRGSSANSYLIWNESTDKWQFSEGATYYNIASNSDIIAAYSTANANYAATNAAFVKANNALPNTDSAVFNGRLELYSEGGSGSLRVRANNVGAPAIRSQIILETSETTVGRGLGIQTKNATQENWFFGEGYGMGGNFTIGYGASQSSYTAQSKIYVTTTGDIGFGVAPSNFSSIKNIEAYGATGAQLRVRGTLVDTILVSNDVAGYAVLGTRNNYSFAVQTNNIERMRIDTAGNVGIGTSSPATLLDVNGSFRASTIRSYYYGDGLGTTRFDVSSSDTIFLNGSGTERARITSGGNVGIGTSSPTYKLSVVGGDAYVENVSSGGKIYFPSNGIIPYLGTAANQLHIHQGSYNLNFLSSQGQIATLWGSGGLCLGASYSATSAPAGGALIAGNVGIGTTSPSHKLSVNGSAYISANVSIDDTLTVGNTSTSGITVDDIDSGISAFSNTGFGVIGSSESVDSVGVKGMSANGDGIVGESVYGVAGRFIGYANTSIPLLVANATANVFVINNTGTATLTGDILPSSTVTYNLGSSTYRWANIYTGDLHLSNEGTPGNDIDKTTGSWVIQEGEEFLYIKNLKNNKLYKICLEEVK